MRVRIRNQLPNYEYVHYIVQCLQVYGFFSNFTESGLALRMYEIKKKITENYMIDVIHQSPDASNHRTPSKYRTEIQVIPTSIHLRLLSAESAFTAARNAHLLHMGFDCRARQAGHFTHVELAVFFPGSTKCKSIATVRTCVWQQIQMSKRLVPVSPFTCNTFRGFAT